MFSLKKRIYISTFVNSFGSWLTFLAIALMTQEKYGTQHVAIVFLVQTLPAIILSRGLASLVPADAVKKVYWVTQVLLGLCSFLLILNQSLWAIYIFLFVTSVLKSLGNPLFNTLIGEWIKPEDQKEVIILRHYADLSFKEIADLTNCSINTAVGRMRYGLINLRKMMTEKQIAL